MIAIRPVGPSDFEDWLSLWKGYQAFYNTNIPEHTTRLTWTRFLDAGEPMWAALAEDAG